MFVEYGRNRFAMNAKGFVSISVSTPNHILPVDCEYYWRDNDWLITRVDPIHGDKISLQKKLEISKISNKIYVLGNETLCSPFNNCWSDKIRHRAIPLLKFRDSVVFSIRAFQWEKKWLTFNHRLSKSCFSKESDPGSKERLVYLNVCLFEESTRRSFSNKLFQINMLKFD